MRFSIISISWVVQPTSDSWKFGVPGIHSGFTKITQGNSPGPPWFDPELSILLKRSNRAWQAFCQRTALIDLYKTLRESYILQELAKRRRSKNLWLSRWPNRSDCLLTSAAKPKLGRGFMSSSSRGDKCKRTLRRSKCLFCSTSLSATRNGCSCRRWGVLFRRCSLGT